MFDRIASASLASILLGQVGCSSPPPRRPAHPVPPIVQPAAPEPQPTDEDLFRRISWKITDPSGYPDAITYLCKIKSQQVLKAVDEDIAQSRAKNKKLLRLIVEMVDSFAYLRIKHGIDFDANCSATVESRGYGLQGGYRGIYGIYINVGITDQKRWPLLISVRSQFKSSIPVNEIMDGDWVYPDRSAFVLLPAIERWINGIPQQPVQGPLPNQKP